MDNGNKFTGTVSFLMYGTYRFQIVYEAEMRDGRLYDVWETDFIEHDYDEYSSPEAQEEYSTLFKAAVLADVNRQIGKV